MKKYERGEILGYNTYLLMFTFLEAGKNVGTTPIFLRERKSPLQKRQKS